MQTRILSLIVLLGFLALAGCSSDPTSVPGLYSLTGRLRLTGYHVDAQGQPAGTRVVGDADGVRVELVYGSQVVASTTTVDGVYTFTGLSSGAYVARSFVIGDIGDRSAVMTIVNGNLVAGDTLRLRSRGDIYPVPNPVPVTGTLAYFALPDTEHVDVRILDMAGNLVRTLLNAERPLGLNQVRWDGLDQAGTPANAALYWMTLETDDGVRAQLLFR